MLWFMPVHSHPENELNLTECLPDLVSWTNPANWGRTEVGRKLKKVRETRVNTWGFLIRSGSAKPLIDVTISAGPPSAIFGCFALERLAHALSDENCKWPNINVYAGMIQPFRYLAGP